MAVLQMKKGTGINGLVREYVPERVEENPVVEGASDKFSELYRKYEKMLNFFPEFFGIKMMDEEAEFEQPFVQQIDYPYSMDLPSGKEQLTFLEVLTPLEINAFFQGMFRYEEHENYYGKRSGLLVSKLIQNSYYAGYNNFSLQLDGVKPVSCLSSYLIGREDDPLRINLLGDGTFNILSVEDMLLSLSERTTFSGLTYHSKNCIFHLGSLVVEAEVHVKPISPVNTSTENCAYITSNSETFQSLKKNVFLARNQADEPLNYLYFQQSDGTLIPFKLGDYYKDPLNVDNYCKDRYKPTK
ncbi:hypothetical protein HZC30_02455 [Candidatus Woesearchaeota archaeon]|nr:hypothetical protein [Candidatus Woesearchaeota archaeon]